MVPALTDTQRRFLTAVLQRLPLERVQEVYLFSPLKQGGVETGVAVVAAAEDVPPPGPGDGAVRAAEESDPTEAAARDDASMSGTDERPAGELPAGELPADELPAEELPRADDESADDGESVDAEACIVVGEVVAAALDAGDEDAAVEALAVEQPEEALEDGTEDGTEDATEDATEDVAVDNVAPPAPPSRFTIFTARYRLQLKGPDRGKWEVDVVEEADAPLVTVDAVVRGVQRRAGELSAVERLSPTDLAAALDEAPWARR